MDYTCTVVILSKVISQWCENSCIYKVKFALLHFVYKLQQKCWSFVSPSACLKMFEKFEKIHYWTEAALNLFFLCISSSFDTSFICPVSARLMIAILHSWLLRIKVDGHDVTNWGTYSFTFKAIILSCLLSWIYNFCILALNLICSQTKNQLIHYPYCKDIYFLFSKFALNLMVFNNNKSLRLLLDDMITYFRHTMWPERVFHTF